MVFLRSPVEERLRCRIDESLLSSRKIAADALDGVESEYRLGVLIRGVKMWTVVGCAQLHEHANHDSLFSGLTNASE
jgi:hypothetical protein